MWKHCKALFVVASVAAAGWVAFAAHEAQGGKSVEPRVFEVRTYYAEPGKMEALHARFRDHTNKLFVKHGMTLIGFWSPLDAKEAEQKMVYILAYPSKEAREKSWKDFQNDPAWTTAKAASEKDGKLVGKVDVVFLKATDYSPIK
jgi:NIPSNAP